MRVIPIELDLSLPASRLVDVVMVQWHTPTPELGGDIPAAHAAEKRSLLDTTFTWLLEMEDGSEPDRPLFVALPELSLPMPLTGQVDSFVASRKGPVVILAGLEYLSRGTYKKELEAAQTLPPPADWFEDLKPGDIVNAAAVWTKDSRGERGRWLQPKLEPYHQESPLLANGETAFLFLSKDQTSGRRLNFSVHVCADFAATDRVRQFRLACEQVLPSSTLDMSFLLQHNENQEAIQFKDAVREYFKPPDEMISTRGGCLVFVNNANHELGFCDAWGGSRLHFRYGDRCIRQSSAAVPTYRMVDDGAHDFQAVVMREYGPTVYWAAYKPRSLVDSVPGAEGHLPFSEGALAARFPKEDDELGPEPRTFQPLPGVCHWLECVWRQGATKFEVNLRDRGVLATDLVEDLVELYSGNASQWLSSTDNSDVSASKLVRSYMLCWRLEALYPHKQAEPHLWSERVQDALDSLQRVFTLLRLGECGLPDPPLQLSPSGLTHAADQGDLRATFLWGGGEKPASDMVRAFLDEETQEPLRVSSSRRTLLILVASDAEIDRATLEAQMRRYSRQITRGKRPLNPNVLLPEDGGLLQAIRDDLPAILYGGQLLGQLGPATKTELADRLEQLVAATLASE